MKIVFTAAVMDCLHEGHVNLLKKMREKAGPNGKVGVILHNDESTFKNKGRFPIQDINHRISNLENSGLADIIKITKRANPSLDMIYFMEFCKKYFTKLKYFSLQNIGSVDLENVPIFEDVKFIYMRGDDWQDFPGRKIIEEFDISIEFVEYTKGVSTTQIRSELTEKK